MNRQLMMVDHAKPAAARAGFAAPSRNDISAWRKPLRQGAIISLLLLLFLGGSPAFGITYRWASTSHRIYVEGPGTTTLSDIKAALPKALLEQVAPAVWHLRANLVMSEGATLLLHGTRIGGDVNEFRLQSNNSAEPNSFVYVSADWGAIDIRSTKIISWDDAAAGPDKEYKTYGRTYIRVRSRLAADGVTALESRMDIIDSEVGYLGYHASESYGLVWKVVGNEPGLYDKVEVYGDIMRSHIHHNYFGMYSYGAYGMRMVYNEMDHNVAYGFDPHDDSDYLVIESNNVHHNGTHGIIASQRCDHLTIRYNVSWNNGGNGIMLHRSSNNSLIEDNACLHNGDSGVALFENGLTTVRRNTCWFNYKAGIRLSVGCKDNLIEDNEFAYGSNYGLYLYRGSDAPRPDFDGRNKRNQFINNRVHHNRGRAIMLKESDDNVFRGNLFTANNGLMWLTASQGNRLEGNLIPPDEIIRTQGTPIAAANTIIADQPSVNIQIDAFSSTTFEDSFGRVFDPAEDGVASTLTPAGSTLTLTTADVGKKSTVALRNLQAVPNAGIVLLSIAIWNMSGDLSKDWTVQAGSATQRISFMVGDLAPNSTYFLSKSGVVSKVKSDRDGIITFTDNDVTTGITEYSIRP